MAMSTPTRLQQPFNILPDLNDESIVGVGLIVEHQVQLSNYGNSHLTQPLQIYFGPCKLNFYWWDPTRQL